MPIGIRHAEAVRQRPGTLLALERLDLRHDVQLAGKRVDARTVEPEAVERALVDATGCGLAVDRVCLQNRVPAFTDDPSGAPKRVRDGVVVERRCGAVGSRGLRIDEVVKRHRYPVYSGRRTRGTPRSASREAEGPAL